MRCVLSGGLLFTRVADEQLVLVTCLFDPPLVDPTLPLSVLGAAEWYVATRLTCGRTWVFPA